jgi:hypothetical protein
MKASKLQKHDLEWFMKRVGHKVYRTNNECNCESCTKVYKYGLVIDDIIQARVLFNAQNELGLYYFDKDIQFPNLQLFRKKYNPNGGKNTGYPLDKIWDGYKMTIKNEDEIINWSKDKIKRSDEVDYENGKDIYWLITITNEWYDVGQSRLSVKERVQKIPLNDYVIKGLPSGWFFSDKDDYTIIENKYLKSLLQELKIK